MKKINRFLINGEIVLPHGTESFDLINPTNGQHIGSVVLGDEYDVYLAVEAAKQALKGFSQYGISERIALLRRLKDAVAGKKQELIDVMVLEYGGTRQFCTMSVQNAIASFDDMITTLQDFKFQRTVGNNTRVLMTAVGVVGIITPWNSSNSFICSKLATAIAAGCPVVIKPSEMSSMQTDLLISCLLEANLPQGVCNIINGLGQTVGVEIVSHPDVAKISFTGSTATGKNIAQIAALSVKRITLELGGKSPNIILADADFEVVIPQAIFGAYMNSGQACIAPTRLLVPRSKLGLVNQYAKQTIDQVIVGDPSADDTNVGPMVSVKQFERVQNYIEIGIAEGATLLTGGPGRPLGLENGNFVKATIFTDVHNKMRIAQEEIFGPVLCIIPYDNVEEAISIANDTSYGLAAYISAADEDNALQIASRIEAGRICINGFKHDPLAPFGGFKQSGVGREFGVFGLEEYLESKTILV